MDLNSFSPPPPPDIPMGWTKCHYYLQHKHRYCRQQCTADGLYCGNHLLQQQQQTQTTNPNNSKTNKIRRERIPCPIDPSHTIYADQVQKHVKKCPWVKRRRRQQQQLYYQHNVNTGGYGRGNDDTLHGNDNYTSSVDSTKDEGCNNNNNNNVQYNDHDHVLLQRPYQRLVMNILHAYQRIFMFGNNKEQQQYDVRPQQQTYDDDTCNLSLHDIYDAIPTYDLSSDEYDQLSSSIRHYKFRSGGQRQLRQQASLLGHLRRLGVFDFDNNNNNATTTTSNLTFVEMGAGRGMFGLMAAGVAAAASTCQDGSGRNGSIIDDTTTTTTTTTTQLILIERSGSRRKADGVLRTAEDATEYMALNSVLFQRICCDLAHVDMSTVLHELDDDALNDDDDEKQKRQCSPSAGRKRKRRHASSSSKGKVVVIAKHLCGSGTDLALKSLENVEHVDTCVMATCCHGVCSWEDYVGRDFLRSTLGQDFDKHDFELMCRWSSGTVANRFNKSVVAARTKKDHDQVAVSSSPADNDCVDHDIVVADECATTTSDDSKDPTSIGSIIESLQLTSLGHEGLGRACQRLLDQGRLDYMQNVLFKNVDDCQVEMFHYVPSSVTPQNAVLIAHRK